MTKKSNLLWVSIIGIIIVLGSTYAVISYMGSHRVTAKRKPQQATLLAVKLTTTTKDFYYHKLKSFVTIKPQNSYRIFAEVKGKIITDLSKIGKTYNKDQLLFQVNDTEARIAVAETEYLYQKASLKLAQIKKQVKQAKSEWQQRYPKQKIPLLFSKEGELKNAIQETNWLLQLLKQRKKQLAKTKITSPSTLQITRRHVSQYDIVNPNQLLLEGYNPQHLECSLKLPLAQLLADQSWLTTAKAFVELQSPQQIYSWQAKYLRTIYQVDANDGTVSCLFKIIASNNNKQPTLPAVDSLLELKIQQPSSQRYAKIVRQAVTKRQTVWTVRTKNKRYYLEEVPITIVQQSANFVYAKSAPKNYIKVINTSFKNQLEVLVK